MSFSFDFNIDHQVYVVNHPIDPLKLPKVNNSSATYSFPALPPGIDFARQEHVLKGTPVDTVDGRSYRFVANVGADALSLSFRVDVLEELALDEIGDESYIRGKEIPIKWFPEPRGGRGPGSYTHRMDPPAPDGLNLDTIEGIAVLWGTPTTLSDTTYTYTVKSGQWSVERQFDIQVVEGMSWEWEIHDTTFFAVGKEGSLELPPVSGGAKPIIYDWSPPDWPDGLSRDDSGRTLRGTPSAEWPVTEYTYTAEDAFRSISTAFSIAVVQPLALGSLDQDALRFYEGRSIGEISFPDATGGWGAYTFSIDPALDNGLSFNPDTRVLSGTPEAISPPKTYDYQVRDEGGQRDALQFSIEVKVVGQFSLAERIPDQDYTMGEETRLILPQAEGGRLAYEYALLPDTLPEGLGLDLDTRVLSGVPTEFHKPAPYTWKATDSDGLEASGTFQLAVDSVFAFKVRAGEIVFLKGQKNGPHPLPGKPVGGRRPYRYKLEPAPPQWLKFDEEAGTLEGTPLADFEADYICTAIDAVGRSDTLQLNFRVLEGLLLPPIGSREYMGGRSIHLRSLA